jgi:hypothetical protein
VSAKRGERRELGRGKPSFVTVDTEASRTIARRDHRGTAREEPSRPDILKVASWENLPVLKWALVGLNLGQCLLQIWMFVAETTDELILWLGVLRAHDASVDLRVLRLGNEEGATTIVYA